MSGDDFTFGMFLLATRLMITTEAMIAETKKDAPAMPGGGMGGMGGMDY
jgi:hypothetical protein